MRAHPLSQAPEPPIDVKERIKSMTSADFEKLKSADHYLKIVRALKRDAWLNIFLGGFNLWLGLSNINQGLPRILQSIAGIVLILQCISMLIAPTISSIRRFSMIMLIFGVWNLIAAAIFGFADFSLLVGLLGGLQIWWAYGLARLYESKKDKLFTEPDSEYVRLYDVLLAELRRIRQKRDEDTIDIKLKRYQWHGWLLGDYAFFVPRNNRRNVHIASKSDIAFAPRNEQQISQRTIKGVFKIDAFVVWGDMRSTAFDRFSLWKAVDDPDADFVSMYYEKQRIPLLFSRIVRGFTLVALIGFFLFIAWAIWFAAQYT